MRLRPDGPNGSCGALIGSPCSTVGATNSGPVPAFRAAPPPPLSVGIDSSRHIPSPWHPRRLTWPSHAGARSTSSLARSPLIASIRPPGRSNGRLQRVSLSSEATARDVTASHPPAASRTAASSARPRTTSTSSPSSATTMRRNSVRRNSDSTRTTRSPGLAITSGSPGQSGAATDVGDPLPRLDELGDRRAIQQMAVPDALDFARSQ